MCQGNKASGWPAEALEKKNGGINWNFQWGWGWSCLVDGFLPVHFRDLEMERSVNGRHHAAARHGHLGSRQPLVQHKLKFGCIVRAWVCCFCSSHATRPASASLATDTALKKCNWYMRYRFHNAKPACLYPEIYRGRYFLQNFPRYHYTAKLEPLKPCSF